MTQQKITPCLWYTGQVEEAVQFYTSVFKNSKVGTTTRYTGTAAQVSGQPEGAVLTVEFEIEKFKMLALNGGPLFKFNPSFSFFVYCESEDEINSLWNQMTKNGEVRMGLDQYPWAEKYGFAADRFGLNWQFILNKDKPVTQKIIPSFLFVGKNYGRGNEAIEFYTSVFKNSKIDMMAKDEKTGNIMHCAFQIEGVQVTLMEGAGDQHKFEFNEAFSPMINCNTQAEIDFYWEKLTSGGGQESQCGWLKDKFGVSWQVAPARLSDWAKDPKRYAKVVEVMMPMKKLDLALLEAAYNS